MTAIVSFIGWHDSGKTTLVSQVTAHLKKRGYSVAVIKSSSETGIVFDTPGTDTYKHRQAGADGVLFVAPDQMVLQTGNGGLPLVVLAGRYFPDVDIVIGEGFKDAAGVAKIEVVRDKDRMLRDRVDGVIAVATDLDLAGDSVFRLDQSQDIADFIRKSFLEQEAAVPGKATLFVNGNNVPLNRFVQNALAGMVAGFVNSLKFPGEASEIELRINLDRPLRKP